MQFGPYDAHVVRDGYYRLDGGSMFGVVPRVLWERYHPPDENNRVVLGLNCLLLQGEGRVVLVDTGIGDALDEREVQTYALERPRGGLIEDLARHGVAPEDVTDVVFTHLHFDHAGGTMKRSAEGQLEPVFPRAEYWLQEASLRWANEPTERDRRSFRSERWTSLETARLHLLEGACEFLPAVRSIVVNGHTPGQQLILVGEDDNRLLFGADLVPFVSHLRIPWIMALDLNPLITLTEKKRVLSQVASEGWVLVLDHDPEVGACRLRAGTKGFEVAEVLEL